MLIGRWKGVAFIKNLIDNQIRGGELIGMDWKPSAIRRLASRLSKILCAGCYLLWLT